MEVRLVLRSAVVFLQYVFEVFPNAPEVTVGLLQSKVHSGAPSSRPGDPKFYDTQEALEIGRLHVSLIHVDLRDQTDHHDNLVFETEWLLHPSEGKIECRGNLFILEHRLSGDGLIILKQAPLPHARPRKTERDLLVAGGALVTFGNGTLEDTAGYPSTVATYSGGSVGRTVALHDIQRRRRRYNPSVDGQFITNTWGDRSKDGRLNEEFMTREFEAAARIGADVVQIDDGWQKGISANSVEKGGVWESYWDADPQFWTLNRQRFPGGFGPLAAAAREHGVGLGLWFGPDSSQDFANWRKDAGVIIGFHREHGVCQIKVDSVKARSHASEHNLRCFFYAVIEATDGGVAFDLDVTAEIRPGYFGMMDAGALFVENRYTDSHSYWPHHTLRNLWQLVRYIDPLRLRMEFLNSARNTALYEGDPLAPANYPPAYLFASVMFTNPLGWFEASNLPAEFVDSVGELVQIWKKHRSRIFRNYTLPIGSAPDGTQWTGFLSVSAAHDSGYILLFREYNDDAEWSASLPLPGGADWNIKKLSGEGQATLQGAKLIARIPHPRRYLWIEFSGCSYAAEPQILRPD